MFLGFEFIRDLSFYDLYRGNENDLLLFALHKHNFCCLFELSRFPFDVQKCSIDIKVPNEIQNYVTLHPKMLKYSGNNYITASSGKSVCQSMCTATFECLCLLQLYEVNIASFMKSFHVIKSSYAKALSLLT